MSSSATACRSTRSPPRSARPCTSTAARRSRRASAASTPRSPPSPISSATRPRRTRTSRSCAFSRRSARARTWSRAESFAPRSSAGSPPDRIVFSGVGKTDDEIRAGLEAGILAFNAESEREIEKIDAQAGRLGRTARVALRVNPDIDPKIASVHLDRPEAQQVRGRTSARAREIYETSRRNLPDIRMTGIQAHIGSQIIGPGAARRDRAGARGRSPASSSPRGFPLETLDVGGGIGIAGAGRPRRSPPRSTRRPSSRRSRRAAAPDPDRAGAGDRRRPPALS